MPLISNSLYIATPSFMPNQPQAVEDTAWTWALPFHDMSGEPIYLRAQDGAELADMIQQRQRRQWGVGFVPPSHPSSSAIAPMMEQFWLSTTPDAFSVPSPLNYPTPESLFSDADNDDSPIHSHLPDVLPDGRFKSTEKYLRSVIEIPPDRNNCPPTRETSMPQNSLLTGQARAGATEQTSSAIDSVEAPSTNKHVYHQPSGAERQEMGAASAAEAAPSRSPSPSTSPISFAPGIPSWRANDAVMTLPSPASSTSSFSTPSPVNSSTRSPSPPPFAAAESTPSTVPSQRQKRRRDDEDATEKQKERKRRLAKKNPKERQAKCNEFKQEKIRWWTSENGKTQDKFRNIFGPPRE